MNTHRLWVTIREGQAHEERRREGLARARHLRELQLYMRQLAFELAWQGVTRTPCYHNSTRDPFAWCLQPLVNHARVVGLTGRRLLGHSFV